MLPDPLIRIQFRRVGREALQMDYFCPAIGQEIHTPLRLWPVAPAVRPIPLPPAWGWPLAGDVLAIPLCLLREPPSSIAGPPACLSSTARYRRFSFQSTLRVRFLFMLAVYQSCVMRGTYQCSDL